MEVATTAALDGASPVGWFAPSYKYMLDVWRDLTSRLHPVISRTSVQERRIELITGGSVEFWTLDKPDAGRGRKYATIVVDEAALVKELIHAWSTALRPTLTDLIGSAWFLSTPKGHNGFWQLWQMGIDPAQEDWAAWQMPTVMNPWIDPSEVAAAKAMLPERVFAQEYDAAFLDDAGGVFRRVMDAATAAEQDEPIDGHDYVIGVDWGKHNDFTVLTVIDATTRAMAYVDRFNQIDYTVQVGRLQALYERFRPFCVAAESNSMGEPLVEQLRNMGLPVQPFQTTNASKAQAIESLALAFERGELAILGDATLIAELQAYEMERLPSGMMRYNAPAGMHDDMVMSLAIAYFQIAQPVWLLT